MTSTHASTIDPGGMVGFHPLVVPHLEDLSPDDWKRIDAIGRPGSIVINSRDPLLSMTIRADDHGCVWLERIRVTKSQEVKFTRNIHHLEHPLPGSVPKILVGRPLSDLIDLPGAENCTITDIKKKEVRFSCDKNDVPWNEPDRPTQKRWITRMRLKRLDGIYAERHSSLSAQILSRVPLEDLREYLKKRMRHRTGACVFPAATIEGLGRITIPNKTRMISVETPSGKTIVHRGKILIESCVPEAMRTGLTGRSARNLIDHPVFDKSLVGRIESRTDQSIIHLKTSGGTTDLGTIISARPDAANAARIIEDLRKEATE